MSGAALDVVVEVARSYAAAVSDRLGDQLTDSLLTVRQVSLLR